VNCLVAQLLFANEEQGKDLPARKASKDTLVQLPKSYVVSLYFYKNSRQSRPRVTKPYLMKFCGANIDKTVAPLKNNVTN